MNNKNKHWSELLIKYPKAQQYALNKDLSTFWQECPKGEWLLQFVQADNFSDRKLIVKAACQIARLTLHLVKPGNYEYTKLLETVERWIVGQATLEEVEIAQTSAFVFADIHKDAVVIDAANAVSAAYASCACCNKYATSNYAIQTVLCVIFTTTTSSTEKEMQLKTADIVRSIIPMPTKTVEENFPADPPACKSCDSKLQKELANHFQSFKCSLLQSLAKMEEEIQESIYDSDHTPNSEILEDDLKDDRTFANYKELREYLLSKEEDEQAT